MNAKMDYQFERGRLYLHRSDDEKQPIVSRLAKIEGQVRGIRQMVEDDRYCGDEINVANAVISAMREVAVMIISQHLDAGVQRAASNPEDDTAIEEMTSLLRKAMRL
jgi:CsoR family transcriptional regulator, copper-sensing transcriptional repressor